MTAEFWEYDPRIGVRWNTDPKPTVGISPYAAFNGNPILNADPLGDSAGDPVLPRHPIELKKDPSSISYVPYNVIGSVVNGGQALISKAGDYLDHPMEQFNNDMGSLGDAISGTFNYYRKTPGAQIKTDFKDFFSNPDNYFHAAEDAFAIVASGKFSFKSAPVSKISVAEDFSLKATEEATGVNRAFWSGPGTESAALKMGFETLGRTRAGRNLIKLTEGMPYYPSINGQPASQAYQWWARLSTAYAKGASGTVHVFQQSIQQVGNQSIWRLYEYPALKANPKVTHIEFHISD